MMIRWILAGCCLLSAFACERSSEKPASVAPEREQTTRASDQASIDRAIGVLQDNMMSPGHASGVMVDLVDTLGDRFSARVITHVGEDGYELLHAAAVALNLSRGNEEHRAGTTYLNSAITLWEHIVRHSSPSADLDVKATRVTALANLVVAYELLGRRDEAVTSKKQVEEMIQAEPLFSACIPAMDEHDLDLYKKVPSP
jgi:hypothetical protein